MLVITQSQFDAMQQDAVRILARRIATDLRAFCQPVVRALSDGDLEGQLVGAIGQARAFGLVTDQDLTSFAKLTIVVGPRFFEHPPFHAALADADTPARLRMRDLLFAASDEDWKAAARQR